MKKLLFACTLCIGWANIFAQSPLYIPPTITSETINLTLQEGTTTFYEGIETSTMGANGSLLGPTLILQRGNTVSITVDNQLPDTTTIHWHGMHVAPQNDGGPHSIILPDEIWTPSFEIMDQAGINWYHPHLHMKTGEHVSKGIAGLIIVKDDEEAALELPRTYGVDDFPIILQTKGFDADGQIIFHTNLDTSVMVNGTVKPFVEFPAQVVRMRVLNGSSQRVMELGFSDNRTFQIIGTDGGLLEDPVGLERYRIAPGQRADILVDLSASLGDNIQLMSYASELPNAIYGATQPGMGAGMTGSLIGYSSNPLNGSDYEFMDITVGAATVDPILTIPATLISHSPPIEGTEDISRTLTFTQTVMGDLNGPFKINGATFDMDVLNYTVPLDNIEIWTLTNQTPIAHPFHIHDVQFYILEINGSSPPPELSGLNDVVLVPGAMGSVKFIAQFNDFANDTIPYMYHCHMLPHEDMGMMGQFIVSAGTSGITSDEHNKAFSIYPNPSNNGKFKLDWTASYAKPNSYQITTLDGKIIIDSEIPEMNDTSLEIPFSAPGTYLVTLVLDQSNITRKVVIF